MPSRKALARRHVRLNARRVVTSDVSAFGRWRDSDAVLCTSADHSRLRLVRLTLPRATAWLSRCTSAADRSPVRLSSRVPPPLRQGCTDRTVLRSDGARRHAVRAVRRSDEPVRGGPQFATFLRPAFRSEWQGVQRSVRREETQWAPCRGRHARSSFRRLEPARIAGRQTDRTADREQQQPDTDTDTPGVQLPPAGKLCHAAKRSAGKQFRTRQRSGLQRVDEATAETQHM